MIEHFKFEAGGVIGTAREAKAVSIGPCAGRASGNSEIARSTRCGHRVGMREPDHVNIRAAVVVELLNRVAEQGAEIEAAELPFVVRKARHAHRALSRTARRPADEQCNRGGHAADGAHPAGHLFDVDTGVRKGNWHRGCSWSSNSKSRSSQIWARHPQFG